MLSSNFIFAAWLLFKVCVLPRLSVSRWLLVLRAYQRVWSPGSSQMFVQRKKEQTSNIEGKPHTLNSWSFSRNSASQKGMAGYIWSNERGKSTTKIMASGPMTSWEIDGETVETVSTLFWGVPKSLQMVTAAMKLKDTFSLEENLWPT